MRLFCSYNYRFMHGSYARSTHLHKLHYLQKNNLCNHQADRWDNVKDNNAPPPTSFQQLLAEAREQRQREAEDDEENEMDRGRQRKIKSASTKSTNSTPGYNPFQEYESQKRWHGSKSGGGGSFPRFYNQSYRQNFQQRNKFKYNRFGGGGGAKFQQQRALQRHLAAGGGFTRRQQSAGAQQQQQQS